MSRAANDSDRFRDLLEDMSIQLEARLTVMDQLTGESERRRARLIHLAKLLEDQLNQLQNPLNCNTAKFIVTELPICGFGCQVHHVALVLQVAYASNRTLFVNSNNWFETFYPVTSCPHTGADVIFQPPSVFAQTVVPFAPPGLRRDWAEALSDIHEYPYAWFRGILVRYILRFRSTVFFKKLRADLGKIKAKPLIGVHIRRTDKLIKEAEYFPLSRYMDNVERASRRFEIEEELLHHKIQIRRTVVLTSDDVGVLKEAKTFYPNYTFIGDENRGTSIQLRNQKKGIESIVYDVFSLANCDHVVCTFSSNICRLVYELLLTDMRVYGDRTTHVQSIDNIYTMHGQRKRYWKVIGRAVGSDAKINDTVVVLKNFWNGSIATNDGRILPAYIVKESVLRLPDK
ncbi:Alpha-(1,6)-fucosyltransferase [Echinococcus granulosus]|uniref:Alpha-(1,6)-fucosyltransferase n=1 Tax=Echinococcus granulosus TaxID=6210 RepID=W6UMG2_ECHGR|nr:Alpha-(1,6)-fucosyltransferase [Echinococcus granulosus]EUB54679.1 Alpha-(1,6)-fucosyltransferase [Echinococcus granulosus]